MSAPMSHGLCIGAMIPILRQRFDPSTRIQWEDNYPSIFQPLAIRRDEMMVVMNQLMTVDCLVGYSASKFMEYVENDEQ